MEWLYKNYTRVIGIFFVLVLLSLVSDYSKFGFRPETMHQVFHVALGAIVIHWGWNDPRWWKPFTIANGAFFSYIALFGCLFPDFGGLDTFNRLDTILHSIVGGSGLLIALADFIASRGKFKKQPADFGQTKLPYLSRGRTDGTRILPVFPSFQD